MFEMSGHNRTVAWNALRVAVPDKGPRKGPRRRRFPSPGTLETTLAFAREPRMSLSAMLPVVKPRGYVPPTLQAGLEPFPGYRLHRFRGRGGCGEVWEARTPAGRSVALKVMSCSSGRTATEEVRSIQIVRRLSHPNLLRIDRVWAYENYLVIAMELADLSLEDLLHSSLAEVRAPLAATDVCLCLGQVAEALDFCNRRQHELDGQRISIQHCDVKPSNCLLCGDTVKLSDFGLASKLTSPWKLHRRAGTLDFAAPEVFQGQLSEHTDQYALAVSYCLLRSGRLPFPDSPVSFRNDYVRPEPTLKMLSAAERPVIARALAPFPQNRWPSCGEFIASLTAVLS
jgi:serine/threonine protein kinase, bacterial